MDKVLFGAIEGGGTKMVMAVGTADGVIVERASIPTETPETTIPKLIHFFQDKGIAALGIGSFGPVDMNRDSKTYGYITGTPKPGWADTPFLPIIRDALNVPVGFDLDVGAAAYGEWKQGAGQGLRNVVYYTIGTGVGAGVISEGRIVHGMTHPEAGHMLLRPEPDDPAPRGFCPFHDGCLEGLAKGPAIEARWGKSAKDIPDDHHAWRLEAAYIAQCMVNTTLLLSPERIILGGGVMHKRFLFPMIRRKTAELLGGYVRSPMLLESARLENYIAPPGLDDDSAIVGCLTMASELLRTSYYDK
ncbi:fructokinase [Clostridia bacterium]|nr:fructokinase [Clostridia bacterium]